LVMALYLVLLSGYLLLQPYLDYDVWTALFSNQVVRTFTMLFLLSLFYHAWVGVRDIVMDYVKPAWMRLLIHVLVIMALLLYAIWAVEIFWGM